MSSERGTDGAADAIAIVGMAGRFPGARDVESLWRSLCDGVELITRLSDPRLEEAGVDAAARQRPGYVSARGLIRDVDLFDASFFGYSPREAELIDPQQRLFLECAWEALESAGYDPERFEGPIGLFAGAGAPGYLLHHVAPTLDTRELLDGLATILGNDKDHLTTRVAYKLNLRGPAITVQTACSTSLVAVQLACQSLLDFQCDMALAGGVSVAFPVGAGYQPQEGHILSPDGHCRAFDAEARGTVPADGLGVVVLKRLEDALAAGDSIRAVILAAAVNNDGSKKVGYTAPSIDGQAEVIQTALALAGVDARSVSYVEAHGTGTALGDAIELAALTQAFRRSTQERGFCAIGSVKTNIGHLNNAAGVAGLIKATRALESRLLPPSLHFTQPHPKLGLEDSPFFVNATLTPWREGPEPRRAGVSSFAMGGTNAHVILEEAPPREPGAPGRSTELLVLSARSPTALDTLTARLRAHLEAHPETNLSDVASTLQVGRRTFAYRRAVACRSVADAVQTLATPARLFEGTAPDGGRSVAFLFPGQGTQHPGMAEALYREEPRFRQEVDRCAKLLEPHLGQDLRDVLYPRNRGPEEKRRLEQTALAQPALFTVEYALARLWLSHGVRPAAMLGHSLGEYVAACLAEVFTLEDALRLVALRGRLMQGLRPGAMLAVPLSEAELLPLLGSELALAAVNGPAACVASGPLEAVAALEARLTSLGMGSRRLQTSHAFHSGMMEPILDTFTQEVRRVRRSAPRLPYLSNVTGTWVTDAQATDPGYWAQHLRQPVRFASGVAELTARNHLLLEVGPGRVLSALAAQQPVPAARAATSLSPSPDDERSDLETWLTALGHLWAQGVPVDWSAHHSGRRRLRVELPTYPFERHSHWLGRPPASLLPEASAPERPLEAVEQELHRTLAIRPVQSYPGLKEGLEVFCSSLVCEYLRAAGVDTRQGAVHTRRGLLLQLGIQPRFERLFDALLASLAEDGILRVSGEQLVFQRDTTEFESPSALRKRLDTEHPQFRGLFDFVEHCLRGYPQALNGRVEAVSILFPNGSPAFVQDCNARTAEHGQMRLYNLLLGEATRRIAANTRGRRLRILEVGGGQGLLTWPLVTALQGHDFEYCFTDLGKVFVDDARSEAVRRGVDSRMRFGVFDISQDPGPQGYAERGFDLIVACNVVHATKDVSRTLRHLQGLLAPEGTLGLVEALRTPRWEVLSWGLAEGWWYYDDAFRKDSPLLPLSVWKQALIGTGFGTVEYFPQAGNAHEEADHGLILARRPTVDTESPRAVVTSSAPLPRPAVHPSPRVATSRRAPRPPLSTAYVAPRNEMERRIAAVCEDLFGTEPMGVQDDFFALGGDSLVMLRLTDRLQRELGLQVPPGLAFRGATVERMAQALQGVPEPETASPLVALQPHGTRPPLYFVHPAAGVVFPYVELTRRLGTDQPFYGLQAHGLDGESPPDERVEDMARRYVEAIRRFQPRGPYYLGGHSFGCLVAYEMAQQFTAAGQEVRLLALIDEPAPLSGHRPTPAQMAYFFASGVSRSIWPHLADYLYLVRGSSERASTAAGLLGRLLRERRMLETFLARSALANFVPDEALMMALRQPAMLSMFRLFLIHARETFTYEPRAYPHRVTLFSSDEVRKRRGGRERTMGWGKLAAGGVDVHEVPGDHLSLLKPPYVQELAARLAASVDDAIRGAAPPRGTTG
ncbi:type I polyketide synthase [Hyalangium versicolor]|uniref:type I polyketide synthase n=1 Tax=Hyalangium versicolor TaxID=2861190 RepID=UPI001CCA3ABB|nr:type I polyketide synthase [Hyalangium versicolor]